MTRVRCEGCGDVIESLYRHDFAPCQCGALAVDGGGDYLRICYKPEVPFTVLNDEAPAGARGVKL